MIRILLAGLLLLAALVPANAGGGSRDSNYNVCAPVSACTGGGSYTGAGDVVSGATAYYSCGRAYNAAYATANGKLCNIIRASDSETCDILAASTGGPGLTANCSGSDNGKTLATFLSATTGKVVTAYDQISTRNVTQATSADQPTLTLNCIGILPCMTGTGTQWLASAGNFTSVSQPYSLSLVAELSNANSYVLGDDNGRPFLSHFTSANTLDLNCGSDTSVTASDGAVHALNGLCSGTSSFLNVDGTDNSISAGTSALTAGQVNLMSTDEDFGPLQGKFFEGGFWNTTGFTSTQRGQLCHNQYSYWGTATSC
jgi:hypothetical protein